MSVKRIIPFIGAMAISASLIAPPFTAFGAYAYTPVAGTSCSFNKNLIMDAGDTVPNATFAFTVSPGTARPLETADDTKIEVLSGIGTPTIANVTFGPSDATVTDAGDNIDVARSQEDRTGNAGTDTVQLDSGEKFATKQATVSFSGITFNEPGVYRYVITETASADHADAGIIHDTDPDRILDVYVTDDGNGNLAISNYVLHTSDSNAAVSADGESLADKTDGFTNEYVSKDLKVEKEVSGGQASRDKVFEFTVTATGVADADSYVVSIANDNDPNTNDGSADSTSASTSTTIAANAGKTNPTTVTGAQLKAGQKFYLQHGQSVVIRGLAPNATYTVTENAENYKSTVKSGDTNSGVIGTVAGENKMAVAGFVNSRPGITPTAVAISVAPFAVITLFGAIRIATLTKRKKEDEE